MPVLEWAAERFYYPNYQVLEIAQEDISAKDDVFSSTHQVLKSMDIFEPENTLDVDNNIEVPSPEKQKSPTVEMQTMLHTSENEVEVKQDRIEDDMIEEVYSPKYFN